MKCFRVILLLLWNIHQMFFAFPIVVFDLMTKLFLMLENPKWVKVLTSYHPNEASMCMIGTDDGGNAAN